MLCYVMLCYVMLCYVSSVNTVQQSDNGASIRDRSDACLLSRLGQSQCHTYNVEVFIPGL